MARNTIRKVDVSYYSRGGLNHLKSVFLDFSTKMLLLIAALHPRGADHDVGLNITPTAILL